MDIGTLTGNIELEDQMSSALVLVADRVKKFAHGFENAFGVIAIGALGAVTAIASITGAIVSLGVAGSRINDVESAFDRLARQAGSTGEALINSLSKGVKGTVDSMVLMQATTRAMQAGVKLTEGDMEALGATARAMGKATGTDAAQGLQTLSLALATGRTRGLAQASVMVDLEGAHRRFAASLGVEVKDLSASGKLHATRTAIMEAARAKLAQLGDQELSFSEKIKAANVSIGNWFDSLKKSVAASPAVNKALDDMGSAIVKAFGGGTQSLLQVVVGWIDRFAGAVSKYGPTVIQTVADIGKGIYAIWQFVKKAWDDVPDWFKEIAKEAIIAGVAVGVVHKGMTTLTGDDMLGTIASFATIWSGFGAAIVRAAAALKTFLGVVVLTTSIGGVTALVSGLGASLLALATSPLAAAVAVTAAVYAVGKSFKGMYDSWAEGKSMWDFFRKGGGFWDNSMIGSWLGMSKAIDTVAKSIDGLAEANKRLSGWKGAADKFDLPGVAAQTDNDRANNAGFIDTKVDTEAAERWAAITEKLRYQNYLLGRTAVSASQNVKGFGITISELQPVMGKYNIDLITSQVKLDKFGIAIKQLPPSIEDTGAALAETSKEAVGFGDALKSVVTGKGFGDFGKALKGSLGMVKTGIFEGFGNLISGGISSLVNMGISALGAGVKKIWNKLFGAAGRDAVREFADSMGGFDTLHEKLGKLGAQGEQLWVKLTQGVGRNNAAEAKVAIDSVTAALGDYEQQLIDMQATMDAEAQKQDFLNQTLEKYGLVWTDVGKAGLDASAALKAADFAKEFESLKEAGVDVNNIWRHMGDNVSDFVLEVKKSGAEMPESFKGVLQTAIDAGEIFTVSTAELAKLRAEAELLGQPFDEAAFKVDDLEEAGVLFGTTMEKATQNVATAVERLAKVLEEKLTPAINNIPDVTVDIRGRYIPPDDIPSGYEPSYASAGGLVTANGVLKYMSAGGWVPRGSDTVPAMLTPGERVLSPSQNTDYERRTKSNEQAILRLTEEVVGLMRDLPRTMTTAYKDAVAHG